jgi:serine/threonine protein kinase
VAIKVYEKFKMNKDPHKFKNIRKEVNIMQNLDNEGVLKLIENVETLTKINLVVEYGGEYSLLEYVKRNYPLSIPKVKDISYQLIKAIAYLHDKNIVHRDIKLQNVLIHNDKIKLIDFGFSCLSN